MYSVQLQTEEQLQGAQLWQNYGIDVWDNFNKLNMPVRVMVPPQMINTFERILAEENILAEIIMNDAGP